MTDTIRCRCGYTKKGHCSQCESKEERVTIGVALDGMAEDFWLLFVEATPLMMALVITAFLVVLFAGCPGQSEETDPGDPETCCACLYDAFPDVGEPCIYESANSCQGHVKAGVGPDTWGVCLAELCGDVCDGVGPFDVIRWEP